MNSLLKLRKNSGLSQQALADYLGVSRSLIKLAEKGLRELSKDALTKLANIEKVMVLAEANKKSVVGKSGDETAKQLRYYHKSKMDDYLFKAKMLERQLSIMLKARQKADTKLKLVSGLAKSNPKNRKARFDDVWAEYHEQESSKKLTKYIPVIRRLTSDIEVQLGYAAVHEKLMKKVF